MLVWSLVVALVGCGGGDEAEPNANPPAESPGAADRDADPGEAAGGDEADDEPEDEGEDPSSDDDRGGAAASGSVACTVLTRADFDAVDLPFDGDVDPDDTGANPSCDYGLGGFDTVSVTVFGDYRTGGNQFDDAVRRADQSGGSVRKVDEPIGSRAIAYADTGSGLAQVWLDTGTQVLIVELWDMASNDPEKVVDVAHNKLVPLAAAALGRL